MGEAQKLDKAVARAAQTPSANWQVAMAVLQRLHAQVGTAVFVGTLCEGLARVTRDAAERKRIADLYKTAHQAVQSLKTAAAQRQRRVPPSTPVAAAELGDPNIDAALAESPVVGVPRGSP